jgi:hypothetical protein
LLYKVTSGELSGSHFVLRDEGRHVCVLCLANAPEEFDNGAGVVILSMSQGAVQSQ